MSRYWHAMYLGAIGIVAAALIWEKAEPPTPQAADQNALVNASALSQLEILRFQTALIQKTGNYGKLKWLGAPIWQPVLDVWTLQETIFEVKPELIIECGTYKGGSSYFFAQLFDLIGHGRVITIDIEKLHDLSHPRVTYLIGDSVSDEILEQVRAEVKKTRGPVMVILDSDHSKKHVSNELESYHPFVTPGSYLHVQDGVIDVLPTFAQGRPGPLRAIEEFMGQNDLFEVDLARSDRFLITHHPAGWLRRKGQPAE